MARFKAVAVVAALSMFASLVFVGTAGAAPQGKLRPFGTGEVTTSGNSATIVIDIGEAAGVFQGKQQGGPLVGNAIFALTSRGDVAGGAPRWSIPINDGAFDPNTDYAFLDARTCGATVGDNPGNVATLVSTQNPSCSVNFHGVDYTNWTAFSTANPTFTIMK